MNPFKKGFTSVALLYFKNCFSFLFRLQDSHEREFIVCDKYLEQIFNCSKMKFAEIPQRLNPLLHPPDPIVINHVISVEGGAESKQTACYDIDVEVTFSPVGRLKMI